MPVHPEACQLQQHVAWSVGITDMSTGKSQTVRGNFIPREMFMAIAHEHLKPETEQLFEMIGVISLIDAADHMFRQCGQVDIDCEMADLGSPAYSFAIGQFGE